MLTSTPIGRSTTFNRLRLLKVANLTHETQLKRSQRVLLGDGELISKQCSSKIVDGQARLTIDQTATQRSTPIAWALMEAL